MLRRINGEDFNFIGDPHMGKRFPDVPLHRRGDREKMQLAKFKDELNTKCDFNIMVGDLFDVFNVSNEVLMDVYYAIKEAAEANPYTYFFWISGNHDISRDANVIHSFDILREMLRTLEPQVRCFTETTHVRTQAKTPHPDLYDDDYYFNLLLCPYSPFKTSAEEVEPFCMEGYQYDVVVGHWDVGTIAGPHNLIPLEHLFKVTDLVITGHEHTHLEIQHGDKLVIKTGSMQPYSHGEDPDGEFYVTRTLAQVEAALAADPLSFHDKCVRLVLSGDEQPPVGFDCLQFAVKRVDTSLEELYEANLDGDFSFKAIFDETFKENGLSDDTINKYWDKYKQEANNAD